MAGAEASEACSLCLRFILAFVVWVVGESTVFTLGTVVVTINPNTKSPGGISEGSTSTAS